jgi:iron complex outermembrane recepter protein
MRRYFYILLFFSISFCRTYAQFSEDSVLSEVTVKAYAADRPLNEVPASLGYLSEVDLQRFGNTSLLPAVNTIAGVRMEERSPGSYRFSIRGSSIRSPFGVRNVKVYWHGLPLTDAGGNTYLNLIDVDAVGSAEIIKGPGGSLYGGGTGGVILISPAVIAKTGVQLSTVFGSYGLQRYQLGGQWKNEKFNGDVKFAHQRSEGYRDQTALKRTALNTQFNIRIGESGVLTPVIFYTDLFYETPGGLTKTQFDDNPRQARPSTPTVPGAVVQQAAVNNETFYGGLVYEHQWNDAWSTQTGIYTLSTDFENPAIRNYETRDEENFGARAQIKFKPTKVLATSSFIAGVEFQQLDSRIDVLENNGGLAGALTTQDDLFSRLFLLFGQADMKLANGLFVTVGGSFNFSKVEFARLFPDVVNASRNFDPVFLPRIALLKKIRNVSVYGSFSQGFSPPTIAELYPSRQVFDTKLNAEKGNNYELGLKGELLRGKISFDIAAYAFQLKETIVIRRDSTLAGDPEYFVNAGETQQRGLEVSISWNAIRNSTEPISNLKIWSSYSYNHYRFKDYIQDVNDLSSNKLTGVPPTILNAGADLNVLNNWFINITANYVDHVPLNDANTDFAPEYFLLGSRFGYKVMTDSKIGIEIFAGIDNALDKKYSLGNDLNAAFGRYYNAAAPRNYYGGIKLSFQ